MDADRLKEANKKFDKRSLQVTNMEEALAAADAVESMVAGITAQAKAAIGGYGKLKTNLVAAQKNARLAKEKADSLSSRPVNAPDSDMISAALQNKQEKLADKANVDDDGVVDVSGDKWEHRVLDNGRNMFFHNGKLTSKAKYEEANGTITEG